MEWYFHFGNSFTFSVKFGSQDQSGMLCFLKMKTGRLRSYLHNIGIVQMFHRNSNYEIQIMSYFDNVVNSAATRIMELLGKVLKRKNPLRLSIKYVRNIFRELTFLTPCYAHVHVRIRRLEMLVFRKILRTYLMDDPFWKIYSFTKIIHEWKIRYSILKKFLTTKF